jgi:hypothetical protein
MTSVNSGLSGGYYDLNSASSKHASAGKPSTLPSLADYLNGTTTTDSTTSAADSAYQLKLSPAAQDYLKSASSNPSSTTPSLSNSLLSNGASGNASSSLSFASAGGFQLTSEQKNQMQAILQKYKDAPYTQDTYNSIQNDLDRAGLSPKKLSLIDHAKNFSSTKVFLAAISGQSDNTLSTASSIAADEKSNADRYMADIIKQWKSISTTVAAASGS